MVHFGKNFIEHIQKIALPGEEAHCIYSPPYRPLLTYEEILERKPRFAAVNIVLYWENGKWYIPLMLRTSHEKDKHSGQISLPGGSKEEADKDFAETALRETAEEIGIERHYIKIIRELSPLYIPPSNFYVKVFLSFTKKNPQFHLQASEAEKLIAFPVENLLHLPETPLEATFSTSRGLNVPYIPIEEHKIWGATSMILSELSLMIRKM